MTTGYNFLVIDMAGMRPRERWMLLLHAHYGVSVANLAETFEIPPSEVRRVLRRARRKYRRCSRRLRVP